MLNSQEKDKMNEYKLTFENNRNCTIHCEASTEPLQDRINEAEKRFNSSVVRVNDKVVKKHELGGFIVGAVIGGILGGNVPAHTVSKTTKSAVKSVKKQIKKFDDGGSVGDDFVPDGSGGYIHEPSGYTIELSFYEGEITYNGTLVEENLYTIYDNDGIMVGDAEPLEVAKETLLDIVNDWHGDERYNDGGNVGQMNNAKSYWNRFDKKRKIDFLISAGFSKSVANDLSNENWDTLEPNVHKKLLAVLMVNGGHVETSEKKYRLLSPDGFDIEMDAVYTESELMPAFEKFKKRFEKQGYYSTSNRERIDLRDLADYMRVVEYNDADFDDTIEEYADGGMVGKSVIWNRYGEEKMGKITEDLGNGKYVATSGWGSYSITPDNIIEIIDTPEPKKRGFFSFNAGGKLTYHNGREYPTGSAWSLEHNKRNKNEKWEKYDGGGSINDGLAPNGSAKSNLREYIVSGGGLVNQVILAKNKDEAIEKARVLVKTIYGHIPKTHFTYRLKNKFDKFDDGGEVKGGQVKIINEGKKFDQKLYEGVFGDFDKDGIVNIDDKFPTNKNKKEYVEDIQLAPIIEKVIELKKKLDASMYSVVDELKSKSPKDANIYARTKTPYSIIKKLVDKRLLDPKKGLTDLIGTTIAVDDYKELLALKMKIENGLLGKVVDIDDFYSNPNAGYMAYHYIIETPEGYKVEVQLKTKRMKAINEIAHEFYKAGNLNGENLLQLTELTQRADNGNEIAIEKYNQLLADKGKIRELLQGTTRVNLNLENL